MSATYGDSAAFSETSIDRVRDYWNSRPCNLRHSPAPVGSREYFDQVEARKYLVEPHIPGFADHPRWAGKRVLEIGCGLGTDTMNFARAGARVTAVDLSSRSLELARQRAEVFGLQDRITFIEADAERLSEFVEPAQYDLVYSFGVIHHTPHPERVLEEIRRHYAGPATAFKMMVYYRWAWKVFAILFREAHGAFWKLDEAVARNSEAQTGCPVTYTYTRRSVQQLLARSGFRTDEIFVDHIFPYRVPDYVKYRYVKAFPFSALPNPAMRALERRLGWHLCVTARLADGAGAAHERS
jgi:SAM-dependent methyltransferase